MPIRNKKKLLELIVNSNLFERIFIQGCFLSPDIYNYYSEMIFKNIENTKTFQEVEANLRNILLFVVGTLLSAASDQDLLQMLMRFQI